MYRQKDGLGMGNILSSILANIFVGYHEVLCLSSSAVLSKPMLYKRYVDDCFSMFQNRDDSLVFLNFLNNLHPNLEFTIEHEENDVLPFLDVNVHKSTTGTFTTSVYRKPTFAGQYQHWNSFCPIQRKINLIDLLADRAMKICSKVHLNEELTKIREILGNNGYPISLIKTRLSKMMQGRDLPKIFGPQKCPVYLRLPYLGEFSERISKSVRHHVEKTFLSVNLRTVFSTKSILPKSTKDVLPSLTKSKVVYQFKCAHCDSVYVGRTLRRLRERIDEHVPRSLKKMLLTPTTATKSNPTPRNASAYMLRQAPAKRTEGVLGTIPKYLDSAIGAHLALNPDDCGKSYSDENFSILASARSEYHLKVLEATFINSIKPNLCRQKKFTYHTLLFPNHDLHY